MPTGDHRPEGGEQHDHRHQEADALLPAELGLHGLGRQVAAQLDADGAGALGRGRGRLQPLEGGLADVLGGHVVLPLRVADGAVGRQVQVADRAHVGLGGHFGQGGVDRPRRFAGRQRAVAGGGVHELGRGAGRRRELV